MKRILKRILKVGLVVLGVAVLVVAGLAIWKWDTLSTMLSNSGTEGTVSGVPVAARTDLPPVTRGEGDWIAWRGGTSSGRSSLVGARTDWSGGLSVKWEADYLCQGESSATWSAPVVQGNHLVVCGRDKERDLVFCLGPEDGRLLWQASYPAKAGTSFGAGFRATPWIDGERVYTFGRSGDLVAWQLADGKKVWHANVNADGGKAPRWGHSTSPLVTDRLVVVNGGGDCTHGCL